jgi:hypothetical protein
MRWRLIFVCAFFMIAGLAKAEAWQQRFDKAEFYETIKSDNLEAIDNEIEAIKGAPLKLRDGYEGALLMKKAGLLKRPKQRLSFFKQGRIKLETAILVDADNTELHFLRLAIEEHAPKIVKYHSDIEKDKALVLKNFKALSPAVQHAILDYCENSKVLHKEEF